MTTKTLTLIRHAKSSWSDPNLQDKLRPLNKRGLRDLSRMNALLQHLHLKPDLILCSTAKRALETLEGLRQGLDANDDNVKFVEQLYEADSPHLLSEITLRPDSVSHLAIIGHNPGLTDLINQLSGLELGNLATCAIAQIRFECEHWSDIEAQPGTFQLLLSPKAIAANE
ncbi:hypothetical protein BTA51_07830 [Hahella sp. CCB-MM4]|uniref:SixA phosphatase family protein n=1 Tax=Hahella sp. (strain CCB-MM4) TaxID=1926491 RepID=UPI000BD6834D|nr:histidine phosphatase family protein [Hahella sp. CCB-MM4]OZG73715.1 hypothetical protein BTA51_07830 [Hahella sp. CCB-MM4]